MTNRTYRVTEIVGTSPDGIDQAIRNGIERAGQTLRHIDWFEVTQVRGQAKDGVVEHFQVGMKVGFRLEDVRRGSRDVSPSPSLRSDLGRTLLDLPPCSTPSLRSGVAA